MPPPKDFRPSNDSERFFAILRLVRAYVRRLARSSFGILRGSKSFGAAHENCQ